MARGADRAPLARRRRRAPGRRPRGSGSRGRRRCARARAGRPGSRRCGRAGCPRCARRAAASRRGGIDVERDRVDVAEDRRRRPRRAGSWTEATKLSGRRQDLVALAPAEARGRPRCSAGGAAGDGDRVVAAQPARELALELAPASGPSESRPERSTSSTSSSSRSPRSGRASGICSATRMPSVRRAAGRRTRASPPAPPRRPR